MLKKITKLLLAASLAFSGAVCLNGNNQEVNANEVQPYAQVISRTINNEIFWFAITDGKTTEYARILVNGTYTHNTNGSSQWPTNLNISVRLASAVSFTGQSINSGVGTFDISLGTVSYSCANNRLVITTSISAETLGNYYSNPITIRV